MDEEEEMTVPSSRAYSVRPLGKLIKFYLSGIIGPPESYVEWFEEIRSASENDCIILHINSSGGDLFTAVQFMRVMSESRAAIVASVEGMCMSAATIPFLEAKIHEISDHSMFLFHNFKTVRSGKGGELYDHAAYDHKWSGKLWRKVYSGFLTEAEITSMIDGKDLWFDGEEIKARLKARGSKEVDMADVEVKIPVAKKPVKKKRKTKLVVDPSLQ